MTAHMKHLGYERFKAKGKSKGKGNPKAAIKRHVRYIEQEKEHHQNTPTLFNGRENYVNRIDFYQKINKQPDRGVVAHKLLLTMSENEWREGKIDLREWTREVMQSYQMQNEKQLDWVAAVHMDKGHPHVHVVVRGIDDQGRQVGFYKKDIKELQKTAERHRERLQERNKTRELDRDRDLLKELEQERTLTPAPEKEREKKIDRGFDPWE